MTKISIYVYSLNTIYNIYNFNIIMEPQLIPLLPSTPYRLAYSLPLLLLSLVLTFAGTFFTLDRTRSFPSRGTTLPLNLSSPKKRKWTWIFEGGVGGLIGGYLFGGNILNFFFLSILTLSSSIIYSPGTAYTCYNSFGYIITQGFPRHMGLISHHNYSSCKSIPLCRLYLSHTLWQVKSPPFSIILSSYRMYQISSFISLAICILIHPSLTPRIILTSTFVTLALLLLLPFTLVPRLTLTFLHPFLRSLTASTGAFGLVSSIALLLHPPEPSWSNIWERLWVKDGQTWGTGRERALSAAFWIFFVAGVAADWALNKWIGECPDEVN